MNGEVGTPVKICGAAFAKPGWSHDAWLAHYSERHGPLIASFRSFCDSILSYRQNYICQDALDPGSPAPNGVSELWFADLDTMRHAFADALYLDKGRADEQCFVDLTMGISLIGHESTIFERPQREGERQWADAPRWHALVYRRAAAGIAQAAFQERWSAAAQAMTKAPEFREHVHRYVQTRALPAGQDIRRESGYDLIDEFWFNTRTAAETFCAWSQTADWPFDLTDRRVDRSCLGRAHLVFGA